MPVEVKVFVSAETAEAFAFTAQVTLHFDQRLGWVRNGKSAESLHLFDLLKDVEQWLQHEEENKHA